ncbi:hypothetical protein BBJ28_00019072, partial [Nothophytophthora sp. Chile5]
MRAQASSAKLWRVGDRVVVKPKVGHTTPRRRAKVLRLRSNGAVDVSYKNGELEECVCRDRLGVDSGPKAAESTKRATTAAPAATLSPQSTRTPKRSATGSTPYLSSVEAVANVTRPRSSRAPSDELLETARPAENAADNERMFVTSHKNSAASSASGPTQRRARTAGSRPTADASPRAARPSQRLPTTSSLRRGDMSDSIAQHQKQVTEILDAIATTGVTAECVHQQNGELLLLGIIQTHSTHAVLLCYGCVLMRKLCHLSLESMELFVQHGIVPTVAQTLLCFPEDAILQASACGCLAVLAQASPASKNEMLTMTDPSVLQLVLASLDIHREYSNLTRQVQIYACEGGGLALFAGQLATSDAPGASFFTSPVKLLDDFRNSAPRASKLPAPRSRDEHAQRAGEMKRRSKTSEQRDRQLMKTYGNSPAGTKAQRSGAPASVISSLPDRGFATEPGITRGNTLQNNYLGTEGVTFVIPPPLSSSQSLEQPIVSLGTKAPARPHSARLTPLVNDRIKFSTARLSSSAAAGSEREDTGAEWAMDMNSSSGSLRPQTAVVVTKVADPSNGWGSSYEKVERRGRTGRDDGSLKKRERESSEASVRTHDVHSRPSSSPKGRSKSPSTAGKPLSRSKSRSPITSSATAHERSVIQTLVPQYGEVREEASAEVHCSTVVDVDESMAELREFAQQLLKEEARISSLFANTGSKSPGLNRMTFSDKLHKMIEIAESTMNERSFRIGSAPCGLGDATARASVRSGESPINEQDVVAQAGEGEEAPPFRKFLAVADEKSTAAGHFSKALSGGYEKSRASSALKKKTLAKTSTSDRSAVPTLLESKARVPSIPFLEPLRVGPEKAPAKQDTGRSVEETSSARESMALPVIMFSGMVDSPQKAEEEGDVFCEESIQEDIAAVALPVVTPGKPEEAEGVIVEHIDASHEESGDSDAEAPASVDTVHDEMEAAPIAEEIGALSPAKGDAESGNAEPLSVVEDNTYEDDQNSFEPDDSEMEAAISLNMRTEEPKMNLKLSQGRPDDRSSADFDQEVVPVVCASRETAQGLAEIWGSDVVKGNQSGADSGDVRTDIASEDKVASSEDLPCDKVGANAAADPSGSWIRSPPATGDLSDQKDGEKGAGMVAGGEIYHDDSTVDMSNDDIPDTEKSETMGMPSDVQDGAAFSLDWPVMRDIYQQAAARGIIDALTGIEALGDVQKLPPFDEALSIEPVSEDRDSDLTCAPSMTEDRQMTGDGNDNSFQDRGLQLVSGLEHDSAGDVSALELTNSILLIALQNVANALTPSAALGQQVLANTMKQLVSNRPPDRHVKQDDNLRIRATLATSSSNDKVPDPQEAMESCISVRMAIEIRRSVASTIAQSLNNAVEKLRVQKFDESPVDDATWPKDEEAIDDEGPSTLDTVDAVSVPMALEIRRNVNNIIAAALEAVAERIRPSSTPVGRNNEAVDLEPTAVSPPLTMLNSAPPSSDPLLDTDNNDACGDLSPRSSSSDEAMVSVQMARAIQERVNGIVATSLLNMMHQFESSTIEHASEVPESENNKEDATQDPDDPGTRHENAEDRQDEGDESMLQVEMAVAIRRSINGLIAVSVQSFVEHVLEDRNQAADLKEIARPDINQADSINESEVCKSEPGRLKDWNLVVDQYGGGSAENNVQDELPVQAMIGISRNIEGIIALSVSRVVGQLCPLSQKDVNDDTPRPGNDALDAVVGCNDNRISRETEMESSTAVPEWDMFEPAADEGVALAERDEYDQVEESEVADDISVDMAIAIQRNVAAIIAVSLEYVQRSLQSADDGLLHSGAAAARLGADMSARENPQLRSVTHDVDGGVQLNADATMRPQASLTTQKFSNQDHVTPLLQELPVDTSISIRRSVNDVLSRALQNVVTDISRELTVNAFGAQQFVEQTSLPPGSEPMDDEQHDGSNTYDHAVVAAAIESFDLDEDGKLDPERTQNDISIQMAIAVRWTVSGMVALAVENAMEEMTSQSQLRQPSDTIDIAVGSDAAPGDVGGEEPQGVETVEEYPDTSVAEQSGAKSTEEIEQEISVGMAVAIRRTVNGIIGQTVERVLAQIDSQGLRKLLPHYILASNSPRDEIAAKDSTTQAISSHAMAGTTAGESAVLEDSGDEEYRELPVQMSVAIRRTVNGLIGQSLQAALADFMEAARARSPLPEKTEGASENEALVEENVAEEALGRSESPHVPFAHVPPLTMLPAPEQSADENLCDAEVEAEEVSVMTAVAISRTVNAVMATGVEKILASMRSLSDALAAEGRISATPHASATVTNGIPGGSVGSSAVSQEADLYTGDSCSASSRDFVDAKPKEASEQHIEPCFGGTGDDFAKEADLDNDGEYSEELSPTMSIAVARSVQTMILEAVKNVSERSLVRDAALPVEYQNDRQLVEEEVLETRLETITDDSDEFQSEPELSALMSLAVARVVNTMTATALESISRTVEANAATVNDPIAYAQTEALTLDNAPVTNVKTGVSTVSIHECVVSATTVDALDYAEDFDEEADKDAVEAELVYAEEDFGEKKALESTPVIIDADAEVGNVTSAAEKAANIGTEIKVSTVVDIKSTVAEYDVAALESKTIDANGAIAIDDTDASISTRISAVAIFTEDEETELDYMDEGFDEKVYGINHAADASSEVLAATAAAESDPVAVDADPSTLAGESTAVTPEVSELAAETAEPIAAVDESGAIAGSVAVAAAVSEVVDAVEADSECAEADFGEEAATESIPFAVDA